MYSINRMPMQDLWAKYMGELGRNGNDYENDIFAVRSYYWGDEDEEERNAWHFWFKPKDLKIAWYKYPLRSAEASVDNLTEAEFEYILRACVSSLDKDERDRFCANADPGPKAEDLSPAELRRAHELFEKQRIAKRIGDIAEVLAEAEEDDARKTILLELAEDKEEQMALVSDFNALRANDFLTDDDREGRDIEEVILDHLG